MAGKESVSLSASILLAFTAGALSASFFLLSVLGYDSNNESDRGEEGGQNERDEPSKKAEPKRPRIRWPWETFRRQPSKEIEQETLFVEPIGPIDKSGAALGSIFGMDIGGTLCKLVYFEKRAATTDSPKPSRGKMNRRSSAADVFTILEEQHREEDDVVPELNVQTTQREKKDGRGQFYTFAGRLSTYEMGVKDEDMEFYSRELGGDFHFLRFESSKMRDAMDLFRRNNLHMNVREMGATGGGAHKFAEYVEQGLGIKMLKQEELASLVAGMQFVLDTVVGECYTFRPKPQEEETSSSTNNSDEGTSNDWWWSRKVQRDLVTKAIYPYLLVTIGTGVSILRVDGPRKHARISGSTIGGGTYWGLIRLLTDVEDFDTVMKLAEKGDPTKVDMMVGDIYGKNKEALAKLGLPSSVVASSFGKLVAKQDPAAGLNQEDLARALLLMITNNIGQVAYLNAQLHKTTRIYFVGNFLRRNRISQRRLAYAINYWSKGEMEALFLEHEGYFGALGAFLLSQDASDEKKEEEDVLITKRFASKARMARKSFRL